MAVDWGKSMTPRAAEVMMAARRVVRWYEKELPGLVVDEVELRSIPLAVLQRLFGVPATDPMYV